MASRDEKRPELVKQQKQRVRRDKVVALLGCLVVLATAFALMVPAITMTQDTQGNGVSPADSSADNQSFAQVDDSAAAETGNVGAEPASPQAGGDGVGQANPQANDPANPQGDGADAASTKASANTDSSNSNSPESASPEAKAAHPAQKFEKELKDDKGAVILTVAAEAPEGALPADSTMRVDGIDANRLSDEIAAAISYDASLRDKVKAGRVLAIDVTFADPDGNKVEPAGDVTLKIGSAQIHEYAYTEPTSKGKLSLSKTESVNSPTIVHVLDAGKAREAGKLSAAGSPMQAEVRNDAVFANWNAEDKSKGSEDTLWLKADDFGTFAVVELQAVEESAAEEGADRKMVLSSQSFSESLFDEDGNVTLTVDVDAPDGALPLGATMQVAPVTKQHVLDVAVEKAASETDIEQGRAEVVAVDITFYDADGNEIEPQADVHVSMHAPAIAPQGDMAVVHVDDDMQAQVVASADIDAAAATAEFDVADFSVYAIVYTVDFQWEINGNVYDYSLPGGGFVSLIELLEALGVTDGDASSFVADVASVTFSDPSLMWVGKVEADTTVGALKAVNNLECEYSAGFTGIEVAEANAQTVAAGDWALISLKPFDTEESLTIAMKNGDVFTIRVTDAQEIVDSSNDTIDAAKSYLICYQVGDTYYLLKNDGSVDSSKTPDDFEGLNSTYCWSFNYVFEEKDLQETLTYTYYLIRPIDNKSKTIALNAEGQDLVQRSNNNVAVVPAEGGGFNLIGYNEVKLNFADGAFFADELPKGDKGVTVHIWEMNSLPTYSYTAQSSDEEKGSVTIEGGTSKTKELEDGTIIHYVEAESNSDKMNAGTITAVPAAHQNPELNYGDTGYGVNKWVFDHWTQDGIPLDRDEYPATIDVNTLPIPFNGSNLVAYFKQDPQYVVPDNEKQPSSIEDLDGWLNELTTNHVPLDESATEKTAEVFDYENRIYRVDISSKADFKTFKGDVDMAFCMDVSNSMYFPSKLVEHTTLPIYRINNWGNQNWLDTSRGWSNPYYLIADGSNTATVFKVYYQDGNWKAQDASRETESDKSFVIGNAFETTWTSGVSDKTHPFNAGDDNNTAYIIYNAGDNGRNRFFYLNQAFSGATTDLTIIKNTLEVAGDESPDVRIAYNTFNKDLGSQGQDFQSVEPITGIDLSNSHGGGTRPDQAFINAQTFNWQGDDRYVILITDGAPQGKRDGESDNDFTRISNEVKTQAQILKDYGGVKFITIGLSMDKVPHGKKLLYDLADNDKDGNRMFFMAESASDLPNILRQVVKTIMDDAVVISDVTDTVGEAFYAVDKNTGMPLKAGDTIDIEGRLTTNPDEVAGVVQPDGVTIKWMNQAIDPTNGWHGTLYVKAKEDLLGGNAVKTNGDAKIEATKYQMDDKVFNFDNSLLGDKLKSLKIDFTSPRVNVNELSFPNESTEWTVYLGEEVDPKAQLKQMYEDILVTEVVNTDGSLCYELDPNGISDDRTWIDDENKTPQTFGLAPLILDLIKADATLNAKYVVNGELNWDAFLADIQEPGGVTVPYHVYGVEGADSRIDIKLTKEILDGEEDDLVNESPHETTVVNDRDAAAEKYVLTVQFSPDYDHVLPPGQGGKNPDAPTYGTGTFGSMYQGHAAGRETSRNEHVVNVYDVPIEVYKTDENGSALSGATFKLYKAASEADGGIEVSGLSGTYVEVASGVSGNEGITQLSSNGAPFGLVRGETYYLIETAAPANYNKVSTVWAVQVQTEIGKFTDLDGNAIYSEIDPDPDAEPPVIVGSGVTDGMYPFNWDQGARIVLNGDTPITVVARGETEGSTQQITNGSFVSHKDAISFQHTVQNIGGTVNVEVNKEWVGEEHEPTSVKVTLYRVSEKGHTWGKGEVVPCTCTDTGVMEYTCSVCGKKDHHVIDAAGHTPGEAHRENEVAATCERAGSYDEVVRCKVCNAIIDELSETDIEIPKTNHTPGEAHRENEAAATCELAGGFDTVVNCSVCGEELSREHATIPALGHNPGEPKQENYVAPTYTAPGSYDEVVYCTVCDEELSRTTVSIPQLEYPEHTVTIYFRCTGDGNGNQSYWPTFIAERSGTGVGDMTIEWDWNGTTNPQYLTIYVDGYGASSYSTYSSGNYNGARQTLIISNITTDLTIDVTIQNYNWTGTDNSLIGQPSFAGPPTRSLQAAAQDVRSSIATLSLASVRATSISLAGQSAGAVRAGDGDQEPTSDAQTSKTHEELSQYINSLYEKADDRVSCADDAETHTYKESVGEYTITADDGWTWSESMPKYNEYGNEYKYYFVETSSTYGYDVTYSGQDDGLHGDDTEATITNTKLFGSLSVAKTASFVNQPGPGQTGTFPSGTEYPILISTTIGDTEYFVQDTNGTLATTHPETPLKVTANGEALTISHLPYGTYTVTEIQPDSVEVPGYSFVVETDGPQAVHSIVSGDGTVGETADPDQVDLVNYYMQGARWQPEVYKWLNGSPHSGSAEGYAGYTFTLTEPDGQNTIRPRPQPGQGPGQQNDHTLTATTDAEGKAVFDTIEYHHPDVHGNSESFTYTITENRPDGAQSEPYISDNIKYDAKTIYVVVTVTKHGGNMEAQASYYSDEAHTQSLDVVAFDNTELASLSVTKHVGGDYTPGADETFPITIKRDDLFLNGTGELVETDPQLTIKANQILTFANIPVGPYVVSEGDASKPSYSLSTTYTSQVGGQDPQTAHSVILAKGDDGSVEITNTYYQVDLTIVKIDETTRNSTPPTMLPAAKFTLCKYTVQDGETTGDYTAYPNADHCEKTTDGEGILQFTGLTDGKYRISESKEPAGYVAHDDLEIYFTVAAGEITWTDATGATIGSQELVSYSPEDATFTVGNTPGKPLPVTGGPGNLLTMLLGGVLIVLAAAILMRGRGRELLSAAATSASHAVNKLGVAYVHASAQRKAAEDVRRTVRQTVHPRRRQKGGRR